MPIIKLLDYAIDDHKENCKLFVADGGIPLIFAYLAKVGLQEKFKSKELFLRRSADDLL